MGNKSKQRAAGTKWTQVRRMAEARQVRSRTSWQGLASPRVATTVSAVGISATETERAHPLRQRHAPALLRRVG